MEEEQKKRRELAEKLPQLELDQPVKVDGSNLADFFYLSCGEEDAMDAFHTKNGKSPLLDMTTRLNEVEKITKTACKITYSGFNPPPSNRKILGDLAYLEITPPKYPNEAVFFVTCIPNGFYVNNTISNEKFDPTPSSKDPCFSHSLLDCLLQRSKSIRNSWVSTTNQPFIQPFVLLRHLYAHYSYSQFHIHYVHLNIDGGTFSSKRAS